MSKIVCVAANEHHITVHGDLILPSAEAMQELTQRLRGRRLTVEGAICVDPGATDLRAWRMVCVVLGWSE